MDMEGGDEGDTYQGICDHIMLLEYRRSHLGMLVVVMLDEVRVAHAWFLLDQDGGFDDFAEAYSVRVACFEDHVEGLGSSRP